MLITAREEAAQTPVAQHQGVLLLAPAKPSQNITAPGRNPRRQKTPGAPKALSKPRAASGAHLVVLAHSNNFGEPQSVPATLRRHTSRVHLSCIHMDSRFSASANGNFHFSKEPATPTSTPPSSSQSGTNHPRHVGVVAFSSQHLIPLLLQTTHLPGNSKIGSQQKSQAEAWDLILSFPILAGDRALILILWGAISVAPHFRRKVVWGSDYVLATRN